MKKQEHNVIINQDACVGCGLCLKDCVAGNFKIEDGKAALLRDTCILCGHCEAICPQGAITITGFADETETFEQDTRLNPEELMMAIKTRRTVRQFTDQKIPKAVIKDIIDAGRLAPTGGNAQDISYVVLNHHKDVLESYAVDMFRKLLKTAKPITKLIGLSELPDDFMFKGAPIVIVIAGRSQVNASLAAENMAFMAEAHGLGVLFSGFFSMCANKSRKIKRALKLQKGYKVVTTLVLGYPAVKYRRTVKRKDAQVRWM